MKARTAIAAAALLALAACGGGGGGGGAAMPVSVAAAPAADPKPAPTEQPPGKVPSCSVAYWGDSIAGITTPLLGKGLEVGGHAVIGGTAQAALPTFLQDPLSSRFIVIQYGTNDSNAEQSIEVPLRSMLDRVKAAGRTAVLTGLSNATQGDMAYHALNNALAGNLAREYGALFVDWAAVPWSAADLKADGVHPADAYAQRLADALTGAIVKAAPECGS